MTHWRRSVRAGAAATAAVLLMVTAAAAAATTRYDPRLRFRTISTPRFDIHFHQGLEKAARRLAGFIEKAAAEVDASIGPGAGRVQVILVDQHDLSNGWATPLPYNTIELSLAAPRAESLIGNTDDWLRLVFVHEYAHIAHLSRAGGWIGALRRVFGRSPLLFPNLFQPIWSIEGIATWQESAVTSAGRVPAGDFRLLIERAAGAGRFEPIDRANGGTVDWPGGTIPYLYGAYFHDYLAARYGAASVRRLAGETARRLPYLNVRAYRAVYGRSLGALWREFREATAADPGEAGTHAVQLTRHGFVVDSPRFSPAGRLYYAVSNPRRFPALMELPAAGAPPREIASRFLGNRIGIAGSRLVVDEMDVVRNAALRSDLVLVDPRDGARRRLTRDARAMDPDVSATGIIVCAVQRPDGRALATMPLREGDPDAPEVLIEEPLTDFASPRWSPDGRWIAAQRRRLGGPSEIVLVDPARRSITPIASLSGGRSAAPAWTPDGAHVLFSAAAGDEPFRIYRVGVLDGAVALLEGTGRSARTPDVSPDGRHVVFVGYTPAGYDIFSMPLDGAVWTPVAPGRLAAGPTPEPAASPEAAGPDRAYSPLPTLPPVAWTPVAESDSGELLLGAAAGSIDALGRHAYAAQAGWPGRARPDWRAAYTYDRWRPTFFAAVSDDTDPWQQGEWRTREADAGMFLRFARVRRTHAALAAFHVAQDDVACAGCAPPVLQQQRRAAVRTGWSFSSAREFGYSISAEEGGRARVTLELPRRAIGSDADGGAATADVRRYLRAGPAHAVLAVRAAAARSWGTHRRVFSAAGPGPALPAFDFGTGAIGLLRGFGEDDVTGTRAAVANADYRMPIVRIDRGIGTLPFFLRSLHAAVFVDAGHAWTDAVRAGDLRVSIGAELSADTVVGYTLPVSIGVGSAWRRNGAAGPRDVAVFWRVGRAF